MADEITIAGRKIPVWTILVGAGGAVLLFIITKMQGGGGQASSGLASAQYDQAIGTLNDQIQKLATQVTGLEQQGGGGSTAPGGTPGPVGGGNTFPFPPGVTGGPTGNMVLQLGPKQQSAAVPGAGAPINYSPSVGVLTNFTGGKTPGPASNWIPVPPALPTGVTLSQLNPFEVQANTPTGSFVVSASPLGLGYSGGPSWVTGGIATWDPITQNAYQAAIHALDPGYIGSYA